MFPQKITIFSPEKRHGPRFPGWTSLTPPWRAPPQRKHLVRRRDHFFGATGPIFYRILPVISHLYSIFLAKSDNFWRSPHVSSLTCHIFAAWIFDVFTIRHLWTLLHWRCSTCQGRWGTKMSEGPRSDEESLGNCGGIMFAKINQE